MPRWDVGLLLALLTACAAAFGVTSLALARHADLVALLCALLGVLSLAAVYRVLRLVRRMGR